MRSLAALLGLLLLGAPRAQAAVVLPVERALMRVSLGPQAGVFGTVGTAGPGALFSFGVGAAVFDRWGIPDPVCEERRRKERARLGGERLPVWGEVLERAQQTCRPLEEGWHPAYDAGLELGIALVRGQPRAGQLRAYFAPLAVGRFTFGLSAAGVSGQLPSGQSALGLRLGPELGWHHRFGGKNARHVLSVLLRPEAAVLRPDAFAHQMVLGTRFLFDL